MKRGMIFILVCFSLVVSMAGADSFQEAFERGNGLYEAGKYEDALVSYKEATGQGSHWKLFYNMGNCHYKLNQFLDAKINYLRASRLNPFEPSIEKNIQIVNKHFKDKMPDETPDFIARVNLKIESIISINFLSVILLLTIFVLNLFIFLMIKKGKNKVLVYGISFSLVVTLLVFSYHLYRVDKEAARDTAVIVTEGAVLRSGPGESNTILFKVNPGMKVRIIDKNRDWSQVSASKQIAGWINSSNIERI